MNSGLSLCQFSESPEVSEVHPETSEKQQVCHNFWITKRVKWTLLCLLDLKLCDGQYPLPWITDYFHFLWAFLKKIVIPHREGCGTKSWPIPFLRGMLPAHTVQCILLQEGEGSCNREQMVAAWIVGTQWDVWGQADNEKAWRASEADTEESAEITDSQGVWSVRRSPLGYRGSFTAFLQPKSWTLLPWKLVWKKDCSTRIKKGHRAILFTNILFEIQSALNLSSTKWTLELWCGVSAVCNPASVFWHSKPFPLGVCLLQGNGPKKGTNALISPLSKIRNL